MGKQHKVLVIDGSKLVRASLSKRLSTCFDVRTVDSVEAAWDALVLDVSIVAVICGLPVASPETLALVERVRANRLARIRDLPVMLIVSDSFTEGDRLLSLQAGVSGFVAKAAPSSALYSVVATIRRQWPDLPGLPHLPERRKVSLPVTHAHRGGGVLVFGLDAFDDLARDYGSTLAARTAEQLSSLLSAKTGAGTQVGVSSHGRVIVVAPATTKAHCSGFASRICQAMAAGQVKIGGRQLRLTVSAGVAAAPDDGRNLSSWDMLKLAEGRLESVRRVGCKHVVIDEGNGRFDHLLALPPAILGWSATPSLVDLDHAPTALPMLEPLPEFEPAPEMLPSATGDRPRRYARMGLSGTLN